MRKKRTIYLVSIVPQGNLARRALDKILKKLHIIPLHRYGIDALIPWKKPLRSPHASSRNLLHHLKRFGKVRYYSLYERGVINLGPDDIFLGQPMPQNGFSMDSRPNTDEHTSITSRTLRENGGRNNHKYLIVPYASNDLLMSWVHDLVKNHADGTILIGATIWARDWDSGPFRDVDRSKVLPIDNAVETNEYPFIKKNFNAPENRKFLYLGHTGWYKNTEQLEKIARTMPLFQGGHIGGGKVAGWKEYGYASFTQEFLEKIAEEYDIFLTVSTADAQATTVMEYMSYGFPIACTVETGYEYPSIIKLSTHDTEANIKVLAAMRDMPETELRKLVEENSRIVREKHSWKVYTTKVSDFIGL